MGLVIVPVFSGLDLEHFVSLPWSIYRKCPQWVPPLRSQDRALLSPGLHPFWQHAERRLFLAKRDGRICGRICALIDHAYNRYAHERCGAFGFFECEDDQEACLGLLQAASAWLAARGMQFMRGPVSPSTNYTCGLLVDGFEVRPALMMPWNLPYYPRLLEGFRLHKEQDLFAYRIERAHLTISPLVAEELARSKNTSRFTFRAADKANLARDIKIMLDLYRRSWAKNWYFSPLTPEEEDFLVHELLAIVDIRYFVLFFHQGKPAGGMVALPDLSPLLQKLNGRLSLTAPISYLQTRTECARGLRIMLFGILEEYRLFGLPYLLLGYMLDEAQKSPELKWVEGSWVLEDNTAICDLIEDFSGTICSRYRIYRKELEVCAPSSFSYPCS